MEQVNNIRPIGRPHEDLLYHLNIFRHPDGGVRLMPAEFRALERSDQLLIIGALSTLVSELQADIIAEWTGEEA
ncbi:hypothetical protein [Candidatus Tokpelaia sp.]|uniref:hypothetical protein n=1 Tax=Candidatus Tokpelaia sp. TaxID=2233777 RepID=UPI00123B42CC|nr:hypothetical protein [Candidatus Tokpelaia sp.]KAA6405769.1 hypothetical protein DPQ22_02790 [Candidatus Tokpelaia sp.]